MVPDVERCVTVDTVDVDTTSSVTTSSSLLDVDVTMSLFDETTLSFDAKMASTDVPTSPSSNVAFMNDAIEVVVIIVVVEQSDRGSYLVSSSKNLGTLYKITKTATGIKNIQALGLYLEKLTKLGCWSVTNVLVCIMRQSSLIPVWTLSIGQTTYEMKESLRLELFRYRRFKLKLSLV